MRRFGDPRRADQRYTRRPGAYGAIVDGARALLVHTECPGEEFALPGGGIDPGESPLQALHREAMEETGWTIRPLARIGAFKRFVYMPEYDLWAEKICRVYLCRPVRRVADPIEADHLPIWVDVEIAASLLSVDGDRALFRAAMDRL